MNEPPGQRESPLCGGTHQRAKKDNGESSGGNEAFLPVGVKRAGMDHAGDLDGTAGNHIGEEGSRVAAPLGAAPGPLPCLNSNNSNELFGAAAKRTAFALGENVRLMASEWTLERVGFLTLTFADHVVDIKEAQKRFNSLRTGVLKERYPAYITVVERQKSGRVHFHLLVVLGSDIRTGFDFAAAANGVYSSACAALRSEWAFWRRTAKLYGFGRTELLPIKSTEEAIGKYVGKYIAKHMEQRRADDKGARLVRYAVDARKCSTRFAWAGVKPWLWRAKLAQFAARHGVRDLDEMKDVFGARWAYLYGHLIADEVLAEYPRADHARADGRELPEEMPGDAVEIEFAAPAVFAGVLPVPRGVFMGWIQKSLANRPGPITRTWADGTFERVEPA